MVLSLSKGSNISLSKTDPGLESVLVGLGWDARSTNGLDFDLDASALLLNAAGKVRSDEDFVFYNQMADVTIDGKNPDEARASVVYGGDNRTGAGDGDDETISVQLSKVPADVDRIVIAVSIHDYAARNQSFGQVRNAYVRIENAVTGVEVARYDLSEDSSTETALVFAEVYRDKAATGEWKFKAVGQGYGDGLGGIARDFGVAI